MDWNSSVFWMCQTKSIKNYSIIFTQRYHHGQKVPNHERTSVLLVHSVDQEGDEVPAVFSCTWGCMTSSGVLNAIVRHWPENWLCFRQEKEWFTRFWFLKGINPLCTYKRHWMYWWMSTVIWTMMKPIGGTRHKKQGEKHQLSIVLLKDAI